MKLSLALAIMAGASLNSIHAFTVPGPSRAIVSPTSSSSSTSSLWMSEPSDTSSDMDDEDFPSYGSTTTTTVDVTSESNPDDMVSNVMDLLPSSVTGSSEISNEVRAAINEALYKLERMNPNQDAPAVSPLLNGVWQLKYAGGYSPEFALTASPTRQLALFLYSGGYSPGIFALNLASQLPSFVTTVEDDLTITIQRDQPRVQASVTVKLLGGGVESKVTVNAKLDTKSAIRLRETYESATVMDRDVKIPSQLQYSRDLYVTYVDEDLLIVRDASGIPEVLVRKPFGTGVEMEPSDLQDMAAPGEYSDEDGDEASY